MRVLIVSPAGSYRLGSFLESSARLGCEALVATDAEIAIAGAAIVTPLDDPMVASATVLDAIATTGLPIDGVLGTDGAAVPVAAAVAGALGLRANSFGAAVAAGDKLAQREACAQAAICQPAFGLTGAEGWHRFPAVVKPTDRAGGQGVIRVDGPADVEQAVATVREIVGPDAPVLVEELIVGTEVAVEALLTSGDLQLLAIFDKPDTPTGTTFPETLLVSPARLGRAVRRQVVETVRLAAAAIGLDDGPVHAECIIANGDVWFLELAARSIGGRCGAALRPGGITLEELLLRHSLALDRPALTERDPTGILMLPIPATGKLRAIGGLADAAAVAGITRIDMAVGLGEHVTALPHGNRYLGFVFAEGRSADAVEGALRAAWACLDVEIG